MKPKIFFIIPFLTKGGAQRVVCNLSNHFITKNYSVFILILNECKIGYLLDDRIKVIFLIKGRSTNLFSRLKNVVLTFAKFYSLIKTESPDYVISFITSANIWAGLLCNMFRIPYLVSERTVTTRTLDTYGFVFKKVVRFFYRKSKAIVVPSIGIRNELVAKHDLHNVTIIKNPITVFNTVSDERVHNRPFILAVGRLNFVKGFDLLIEAFNRLESKSVDLLIVGDGKERSRLEQLVTDKGLSESIFFPGRKDNMQDYYSQCTLFVLSSRNEGYPNVLIEAMSAGCSCVAFDCQTGPSEIIETGRNGVLVENGNVAMLANSINYLLKDNSLRHQLGLEARSIAQGNSIQEIACQWEIELKER